MILKVGRLLKFWRRYQLDSSFAQLSNADFRVSFEFTGGHTTF